MTECLHTGHSWSLMYLCIDRVTCVESINFISMLLPSKCNMRSICLDFFSRRVKRTCSWVPGFGTTITHHPALIYGFLCSQWLQADISPLSFPLFQQILFCPWPWYWFISSHLSGPILPLFSVHTQPWHSGHRIGGGEGGKGGAYWDKNDEHCFFHKMHIS